MKKIMILFVAIFLVSVSLASAYDLEVVSITTTGDLVADSNITFDVLVRNNEAFYNSTNNPINLSIDLGNGATTHEFALNDMNASNSTSEETFTVNGTYDNKGTFTFDAVLNIPLLINYNDTNVTNNNLSKNIVIENTAPVVDTIANQEVIEGEDFTYQVDATDVDGDSLTYSIDSLDLGSLITISTSGLISYPDAQFFDHDITVNVSDGEVNTTQTFTISVIEDTASFEIDESTIELGGEDQERETETERFFTVRNTGTRNLSNFEFTNNLASHYDVEITFSNTVLIPGAEREGRIKIMVPKDQNSQREKIGTLTLDAQSAIKNITTSKDVYLEAESLLKIKNIEIKTEKEHDSSIKEDDTVSFFKESDDVEMTVTVENLYNDISGEDFDIDNVYVKVSPHRDEWFNDEESSEERIHADSEKDINLDFQLEDNIDYDSTTVFVEVFGDDGNENFNHYDTWEITFELDRETHEVTIKSAEIVTNSLYGGTYDLQHISCEQSQATIETNIKNIGVRDEDNVVLRINSGSNELDFSKTFTNINLNSGDSDTLTTTFSIPEDLKVGDLYSYTVQVYYDGDKKTDEESIVIKYVCEEEPIVVPPTPTPIINPTPMPFPTGNDNGERIQSKPVGKLNAFRGTTGYLVALAIIFIVMLAIVVSLAGSLVAKKKVTKKK